MTETPRTVGLVGAVSIGVGGMIGGGIFAVLGEAVSLARGAAPLAFLIGGVLALLTAIAYARLAVAYPSRGGTVAFVDAAFGNNLLSGSLNLMLWLSYLVTIALYATAFAAYGLTFFGAGRDPLLRHVLISLAIAGPAAVNLVGAAAVSRAEAVIVGVKIVLLCIVVFASLPYLAPAHASPAHWGTPLSVVSASMIIFVAYEGFELIANSAEDIRRPNRNLPLALIISVLAVAALYVLIALVTVSTVSAADMLRAKDYVLAVAAEPALGPHGFTLVAWAALLATLSAINATIYGNARLGYVLALDGVLPERFDHERHHRPVTGIVATAALSLLLANTVDLTDIAIIGSASFLLVFALVNAAAWRLSPRIGGPRPLFGVASALCLAALAILVAHTCAIHPGAVAILLAFMSLSGLFEFVYGRGVRGHFLHRRYGP